MKPAVSIVIPVYNSAKYLSMCLDSVLHQTLQNIEILCIDDGSMDESRDILQSYETQDDRIRVIDYKNNHGPAYARNVGLDAARGKYIFFLDSDDMIVPGAFSALVEFADNEALDIVFFDAEIIYENEEIKKNFHDYVGKRKNIYPHIYSGYEFFFSAGENGDYDSVLWRRFFKKSFLRQNQLHFLNGSYFGEDTLFCWQTVLLAKRVRCLNRSYYIYRRREGSSMTSPVTIKRLESAIAVHCEEVRFLCEYPRDIVEMKPVYDFLALSLSNLRKVYIMVQQAGNDMTQIRFSDPFYEMIYRAFILQGIGSRQLSLDELEKIDKAQQVIIYGAGKVGKDVLRYLSDYNINRVFFAVTRLAEEPQYVMGNLVHSIDEFVGQASESIVLLAVTRRYQDKMLANLDALGFCNVLVLV